MKGRPLTEEEIAEIGRDTDEPRMVAMRFGVGLSTVYKCRRHLRLKQMK